MRQPKFKFGDKVTIKTSESVFIVAVITWDNFRNIFYYSSNTTDSYREDDLTLYQEPQKKKLYAYESDGFISFKRHEKNIHPVNKETAGVDAINWEHVFKRVPEYDIEFSEASK